MRIDDSRRFLGHGRSPAVMLVLAIAVGVLAPGVSQKATAARGGLERLGDLPVPNEGDLPQLLLIDPTNRRLYVRWGLRLGAGDRVVEYDLTTRVPRILRQAPLPVPSTALAVGISPNTIALDAARKRAFILDRGGTTCEVCSIVKIWDLNTLAVKPETWNLSLMVPNFSALGITYSAQDGRVYIVGTIAGDAAPVADQAVGLPSFPVAVMALDASTGAMKWFRVISECQHPAIVNPGLGAAIFRSKRISALYLACIRGRTNLFQAGVSPGQTTLVRLWITLQASTTDAVNFRREVFPISGVYANGGGINAMVLLDEVAERVYLLNTSATTSGAWVFDGLLSAWVGFVPAVDDGNVQMGVDQANGHFYMRSGRDNQIIVTDGRATPVPQGDSFPFDTTLSSNWYLSDPVSHRIFVRRPDIDPKPPQARVLVLEDRTPSAPPTESVNYDTLTTDVAEGPATAVSFAGTANGFGTRLTLVGGYGGFLAVASEALGTPVQLPGGLSPGPRSAVFGRAAGIDLSNVGASASAQAVALDTVTDDELNARRRDISNAPGGAGEGVAGALIWPWPASVCLDAGEKNTSADEAQSVGRSAVTCDLKQARSSARAIVENALAEGVSIMSSSFDSTVSRSAENGTVTESTAIARGVEVTVPGGGRLTIGRVTATVRTAAHGRPGTAGVRWTREIDSVLLTDASGKTLYRCPESCSPEDVATAVNDRVGERVRITVPDAEMVATPRGAFAGIKETRQAYLDGLVVNDDDSEAVPAIELLITNDSGEKSRVQIQLAAIQASSIYGISLLPAEGSFFGPAPTAVPPLPDIPSIQGPGAFAPPSGTGESPLTVATSRSSLFAVRSAADAMFLSLVLLLILATIAGAIRRYRFTSLLNGGSQR